MQLFPTKQAVIKDNNSRTINNNNNSRNMTISNNNSRTITTTTVRTISNNSSAINNSNNRTLNKTHSRLRHLPLAFWWAQPSSVLECWTHALDERELQHSIEPCSKATLTTKKEGSGIKSWTTMQYMYPYSHDVKNTVYWEIFAVKNFRGCQQPRKLNAWIIFNDEIITAP